MKAPFDANVELLLVGIHGVEDVTIDTAKSQTIGIDMYQYAVSLSVVTGGDPSSERGEMLTEHIKNEIDDIGRLEMVNRWDDVTPNIELNMEPYF